MALALPADVDHTAARHVDALRCQAKALGILADALEAEVVLAQHLPRERPDLPGAFDVHGAAAYCAVGTTLLRAEGPPGRYVSGRLVYVRAELDAWLAGLPTEPTHQRGRRSASTGAKPATGAGDRAEVGPARSRRSRTGKVL